MWNGRIGQSVAGTVNDRELSLENSISQPASRR
jgi:hypothetical protein